MIFNIYLNDLFFFLKDVSLCNFAGDATTNISDKSLENALKSPEKSSMFTIHCFENNDMKLNTDKCHLIVPIYKCEQVWTNIEKDLIWESNDIKLLWIIIDRDLKLNKHVLKRCSKANKKLSAFSRMTKLLSSNKRRALFKVLVESQFKYCPIVDVPTTKLIDYFREPLELLVMTTIQLPDIKFDQLPNMEKSFCSPSKYRKTLN